MSGKRGWNCEPACAGLSPTSRGYDALTVFDAHAAADLIADVETFVRTVEAVILPPDTPATA